MEPNAGAGGKGSCADCIDLQAVGTLEFFGELLQGRIDPPKAGRGHATPVQPVQRAKCWRLLNLELRFEWYHVRARHNALIYRPYKETANVFLVTASISPTVLAVWELHALSPPSAGRYALGY